MLHAGVAFGIVERSSVARARNASERVSVPARAAHGHA
jgi:hypothetical protein